MYHSMKQLFPGHFIILSLISYRIRASTAWFEKGGGSHDAALLPLQKNSQQFTLLGYSMRVVCHALAFLT